MSKTSKVISGLTAPFSPPRPQQYVPTHFPAHEAKLSRSCYCLNTAGDALRTDAQHTRHTKANPRDVDGASNEGRANIWIGNPIVHHHLAMTYEPLLWVCAIYYWSSIPLTVINKKSQMDLNLSDVVYRYHETIYQVLISRFWGLLQHTQFYHRY